MPPFGLYSYIFLFYNEQKKGFALCWAIALLRLDPAPVELVLVVYRFSDGAA